MKFRTLASAMLFSFIFLSCVSNKKFEQAQNAARSTRDSLMGVNSNLLASLNTCKDSVNAKDKRISELQYQNSFLKENNTQALKQLQDLSVITSTQAESIKKSMENIGVKDMYIMDLQKEMAKKDSLNMALVMNLKGAIGNLSDEDINIKVDKGVVFIDISDKLLFKSGKYDITDRAKEVLEKVALVLKNWDLSVKRATAVVRVLQNEYGLSPYHITAAGRSEYQPVATNATEEGRALNRRTRIVILPQLDQFFKLLETK
jgi:chemotaxis protein MotB